MRSERHSTIEQSDFRTCFTIVLRWTLFRRVANSVVCLVYTTRYRVRSTGGRQIIPVPAKFGAVTYHAVHDDASLRASATIALRMPRRLATFIAQAFSHDHFVTRTSMICAAS